MLYFRNPTGDAILGHCVCDTSAKFRIYDQEEAMAEEHVLGHFEGLR